MHPSQYIVLNSPDERIAASAVRDFVYHADFLDALGVGNEAKIVTHVGGAYDDREAALDRFVARYETLPEKVRARLVLENDERLYGVRDTLAIHERCGVPLVFDNLHHGVNNPEGLGTIEACRRCLATWPSGERPKIHISSQRREERDVSRRDRQTGETTVSRRPAKAGQHADGVDAAEFLAFIAPFGSPLPFDVMLEAKRKDLALLRLRDAIAAAGKGDTVW